MVTRSWRKAIDFYFDNQTKYDAEKAGFKKELEKVSNRGFTTGFYYHKPNQNTNNYKTSRAASEWGFVGIVNKYDDKTKMATVEVKNYLPKGANLEIITPDNIIKYKLKDMYIKGEKAEVAHANYIIDMPLLEEIPENSFVRMKLTQK